jgi:hypothetical protein
MGTIFLSLKPEAAKKGDLVISSRKDAINYQIPKEFNVVISQGVVHKDSKLKDCWNKKLGVDIIDKAKYKIDIFLEGSPPDTFFLYDPSENKLYYVFHDEYAQMNNDFRKMMLSLKEEKTDDPQASK